MGRRNGRDQRTHSEVRARRYLYQMRPYTEEPSAEQFACSVLDWRRVERSTRRPYGRKRPLGLPIWAPYCLSFQGVFGILSVVPITDRGNRSTTCPLLDYI